VYVKTLRLRNFYITSNGQEKEELCLIEKVLSAWRIYLDRAAGGDRYYSATDVDTNAGLGLSGLVCQKCWA